MIGHRQIYFVYEKSLATISDYRDYDLFIALSSASLWSMVYGVFIVQ